MKKIIIVLSIVMMGSFMQAQITQNVGINKGIEEEYLVELFRDSDVVFSKIDEDGPAYVKNMLVVFTMDSSIFESAYIESSTYDTVMMGDNPVWCTYVELDDIYGNTLRLTYKNKNMTLEPDEQQLNNLGLLRPVLDSLLQKTDTCDYARDTRIFIDIYW